jgi:hypothetical protein
MERVVTRSSTRVDPPSFPTLNPGRSTRDRGTRRRPRFLLLWSTQTEGLGVAKSISLFPCFQNERFTEENNRWAKLCSGLVIRCKRIYNF